MLKLLPISALSVLLASLTAATRADISCNEPPAASRIAASASPATAAIPGNWEGVAWPGGVVPYRVHPEVSFSQGVQIRLAMAEIEGVCGVDFILATNQVSYLYIRENPNSTTVSNSKVGMQPLLQHVNIAQSHWDARFVIVHELMHALGFKHEHQRLDRDAFVTIHWNAINPYLCTSNCSGNFVMAGSQMLGSYDFDSLMHYSKGAFGYGNSNTITCKPGFSSYNNVIGHGAYLSPGDAQALQTKYGLPTGASITSHAPNAVVAGVGEVALTLHGSGFFKGSYYSSRGVQGSKVQYLLGGVWHDAVASTVAMSSIIQARINFHENFPTGVVQLRVWNDGFAGGPSPATFIVVSAPPCATANERLGEAVVGLPDIDSDGHDEAVLSQPGFSSGRGRVVCRSGANGQLLWQFLGPTINGNAGTSLALLGDVNQDGVDDIASGAPGFGAGSVHILSGQDGSVLRTISGAWLNSGPGFGTAVSAAGDLNLDGIPDLVVGSPLHNGNRGRVDLISGASGGVFFAFYGLQANERFGSAVTGGFDLDGDGRPEVAVGAPLYDGANGINCGRVAIYRGAFGTLLAGTTGDDIGDRFGHSLAMAPSSLGQRTGCVAVGAPETGTHTTNVGKGYVRLFRYLTGQVSGLNALATWQHNLTGARYGHRVVAAGDVDDDGGTDFLISAPGSAPGTTPVAAEIELRSGRTSQVLWRYQSNISSDEFGTGLGAMWSDELGLSIALIGAPLKDGACPDSGVWFNAPMKVRPAQDKLMITEIASAFSTHTAGAIELTNFSGSTIDLSDWQVRWRDSIGGGSFGQASSLAGILIAPQESIILRTQIGAAFAETPPSVQVHNVMTGGAVDASDYVAALIAPNGYVVDEVRSENPNGTYLEGSYGGKFDGRVPNHNAGPILVPRRIERVWGLDSNSSTDWTVGAHRSLGLENLAVGAREPRPRSQSTADVRINEVSQGSSTYVELVNRGTSQANLQGYSLRFSAGHGSPIEEVLPFVEQWFLSAGNFVVVGSTAQPPAEMPSGVGYRRMNGLSLGNAEFTVGLYNATGQVVDVLRATRRNSLLVHNHPRLPGHATDFRGAARVTGPAASIGRNANSEDTDTSDDWRSYSVRSMGAANAFTWVPDSTKKLDVRVNRRPGVSLALLLDGDVHRAGDRWSFAVSFGHSYGQGPVLGLGPDAINNWLLLSNTPPFWGVLNGYGDARLDLDESLLPPGLQLDFLFVLQDGVTGQIVHVTPALMHDS